MHWYDFGSTMVVRVKGMPGGEVVISPRKGKR